MIKLSVKKENLDMQLMPIRYKDIMVFATGIVNNSQKKIDGLYGLHDNIIKFVSIDELDDNFEIEVPESIQEIEAHITAAEYLIHRLMFSKVNNIDGLGEVDFVVAMKPFLDFLLNYEKNKKTLEETKIGFI